MFLPINLDFLYRLHATITCPSYIVLILNIKINIIHVWAYYVTITVNREYFDFSDSMACAKIKRTKYMRNINENAVQGRLSENYLTRKIIAWNILDTKYSRFTVIFQPVCIP